MFLDYLPWRRMLLLEYGGAGWKIIKYEDQASADVIKRTHGILILRMFVVFNAFS
jgi:hypothetical protein